MMRVALIMGLGLMAILLTSCASVSSLFEEEKEYPIVLLNRDLERTLQVDRKVCVERNKSDELCIRVKMKNITEQEILHLQAQTIWSNEAGQVVSDSASWQTLALTPGQTVTYEETAPTLNAKNFTVRIRYLALASDSKK